MGTKMGAIMAHLAEADPMNRFRKADRKMNRIMRGRPVRPAASRGRMSELQLEMMDPELSANYERLMELQTKIDEENQTQESLLERMMETELELEEMETQDE